MVLNAGESGTKRRWKCIIFHIVWWVNTFPNDENEAFPVQKCV